MDEDGVPPLKMVLTKKDPETMEADLDVLYGQVIMQVKERHGETLFQEEEEDEDDAAYEHNKSQESLTKSAEKGARGRMGEAGEGRSSAVGKGREKSAQRGSE